MTIRFIFYIMLIAAINFFAQISVSAQKQQMPFKPKIAPSGTIWLRDSLFIEINPTRNADYKKFENFVQIAYNKALKDSMKNMPKFGIIMEDFQKYMRFCGSDKQLAKNIRLQQNARLGWNMNISEYFNNPIYANYPIIYVSMSQATNYCQWLTDITMLIYASSCKNEKQRSKYYTKIQFRLPTPEEMQYAIEKFNDNIFENYIVFAKDRCATMPPIITKNSRKPKFIYIPRNVAEMTLTENTAVGMSWRDNDTTNNYNKIVKYNSPCDWLGFRCVCKIIEY